MSSSEEISSSEDEWAPQRKRQRQESSPELSTMARSGIGISFSKPSTMAGSGVFANEKPRSGGMMFAKAGESKDDESEEEDTRPSMGMRSAVDELLSREAGPQHGSQQGSGISMTSNSPAAALFKPKQEQEPKGKVNKTHAATYGLGAKLLGKMGYVAGKGLGSDGSGIAEPIQQKLRPQGVGLGAVEEKTAATKRQEKARGKDSRDSPKPRQPPKPRTVRVRDVYSTVSELEATGMHVPQGLRDFVDMRGPKPEVRSDFSSLASTPGSLDDSESGEDGGDHGLEYRKVRAELSRLLDESQRLHARKQAAASELQQKTTELAVVDKDIKLAEGEIALLENVAVAAKSADKTIDSIAGDIDTLQANHASNTTTESVVASVSRFFERAVASWDPLTDPVGFSVYLERWKPLLMRDTGRSRRRAGPYDSMMYHVWLPRMQSVLTNRWDVDMPASALVILEHWEPVVPQFVVRALLKRVVVTKLQRALDSWRPEATGAGPSTWLVPWLPHLGSLGDPLLATVRTRLASYLRKWRFGLALDTVSVWHDVFGDKDFDSLISTALVPRIIDLIKRNIAGFGTDAVSVVSQALELRPHVSSLQLDDVLDDAVFPAFVRHAEDLAYSKKLIELADWLQLWWSVFNQHSFLSMPSVRIGMRRALDAVNKALGRQHRQPQAENTHAEPRVAPDANPSHQVTFRDVVEHYCAANDLFFVSLRKAHETLGHPLYRVSTSPSGAGIRLYLHDDVVWIEPTGRPFEPISLDSLASRVTG